MLDIGCNAGFYSTRNEASGRATACSAIDLGRAIPCAGPFRGGDHGLDIEFRRFRFTTSAQLAERFDIVLFMGVLYHLRHPLLALDLIHEHVVARPDGLPVHAARLDEVEPVQEDYPFSETEPFDRRLVRSCTSSNAAMRDDPTNWWVPNRACAEAMLRSAGFAIIEHPEARGLCLPTRRRRGAGAVYPA